MKKQRGEGAFAAHQIGVADSQCMPTVLKQELVARDVLFDAVIVTAAIEFEDKFGSGQTKSAMKRLMG